MAKFVDFKFGKDVESGMIGLFALFESEHKQPGKVFFYFVPFTNDPFPHVYNSLPGEYMETESGFTLNDGSFHNVEVGDYGVPENDKQLMMYNFMINMMS